MKSNGPPVVSSKRVIGDFEPVMFSVLYGFKLVYGFFVQIVVNFQRDYRTVPENRGFSPAEPRSEA